MFELLTNKVKICIAFINPPQNPTKKNRKRKILCACSPVQQHNTANIRLENPIKRYICCVVFRFFICKIIYFRVDTPFFPLNPKQKVNSSYYSLVLHFLDRCLCSSLQYIIDNDFSCNKINKN